MTRRLNEVKMHKVTRYDSAIREGTSRPSGSEYRTPGRNLEIREVRGDRVL